MQDLLMEMETEKDCAIQLDGEIVEIISSGIRTISVDGTIVSPDQDKNVNLPIKEKITAYLQNNIGNGLQLNGEILSVDTANDAEEDNTKPITSGAVYTEIGNIDALLKTI
ncbi:MAG: hypothetical protein ACOX7K_09230 [Oscillospiraceae bacterium]|jgi:hypothetical protein